MHKHFYEIFIAHLTLFFAPFPVVNSATLCFCDGYVCLQIGKEYTIVYIHTVCQYVSLYSIMVAVSLMSAGISFVRLSRQNIKERSITILFFYTIEIYPITYWGIFYIWHVYTRMFLLLIYILHLHIWCILLLLNK